jgi:hypothetical protein
VISDVICILLQEEEVAGDERASASSGLATNHSISCEIGKTVNTSRRVRSRKGEGGRKEGLGHHGWVEIGDARRWRLQVPDEKFVRLERFFVREKKRGRGRSDMAIYSRGWRARGARVWTRGRSDVVDGVGLLQVS